jgi:lipopolysaccharide transport system permease protein
VTTTSEGPPTPADAAVRDRSQAVLRIAPPRRRLELGLGDVWGYRELLYFLVWRDVKVRYKQAALGVTWVVLQPVLMMTLFSVVFGRFLNAPSNGVPYPAFVLAALMPWQLFAIALSQSGNSLVTNQQLVTKIHFPRILLPVSAVLAGFVDFAASFVVLMVVLAVYGIAPTVHILLLPAFLLLAVIAALSVGILLAALNARYRDVQHLLPTLTQFWFFATPIAYASTLVPDRWRPVLGLNPMASVADGFRWALLDQPLTSAPMIVVSAGLTVLLAFVSLAYFHRTSSTFADVV